MPHRAGQHAVRQRRLAGLRRQVVQDHGARTALRNGDQVAVGLRQRELVRGFTAAGGVPHDDEALLGDDQRTEAAVQVRGRVLQQ
jgi:hypothetical protein